MERIRAAAQGMHRLIDDLLESSTSREQQLRTSVVDLESMARSVAEQRSSVTTGADPAHRGRLAAPTCTPTRRWSGSCSTT